MTVRIAFPFVGDTVGGSHHSAGLLMSGLLALGFDPVALVHRDGPLLDHLSSLRLPVSRVDLPYLDRDDAGARALAKLAVIAPRLALFLRRGEFNLVHANDGRMISSWMPAARLAGVPGVAHRRTQWSKSRLSYIGVRAAHAAIAISAFVHGSMPPEFASKTTVLFNPFSTEYYSRTAARIAAESAAGGGGTLIVFVGTLQRQKRPQIFLQAAAHIYRRRPETRFLLIGRDHCMQSALVQQAMELGIADRVRFTGYRPDAQLLVAGCNLLLAPAVDEGHGRTLVEAMLLGTPVIAADSGGHREIIRHGENGFLFPIDDAVALSEFALLMLDEATAAKISAEARSWAERSFMPEDHAQAVAKLYADLGVRAEGTACTT